MKICYFTDTLVHFEPWMRTLSEQGHEVHLVTFNPLQCKGVETHYLWEPFHRSYLTFFMNIPHARKILNKIKPDIIHAYYLTNFSLLAALSGMKPLMVSAAGGDVFDNIHRSFIFNMAVKYSINKADLINSVSPHMSETLIKLGATSDKIVEFPKGIDMEVFHPLANVPEDKEIYTVICNRRMEPIYNVELLVKAIPIVVKEINNIRFILVFSGPLQDKINKMIDDLGISRWIEHKSWLPKPELADILREADVFVSTTFYDGTSVSLLEAMASGSFPVVTDIPANRQFIKDGENGFLVPIDDPEMLAKKIISALRNKTMRTKATNSNHDTIETNFTKEKILKKLLTSYQRMINNKN